MIFLQTLGEILEHIKTVESEVVGLSKEAQLRMVALLEKNGVVPDDETVEAMQYQDIIAQQLGATIEVIETVRMNLDRFEEAVAKNEPATVEKLDGLLRHALGCAQEKHEAFSGKTKPGEDDEGIEFF